MYSPEEVRVYGPIFDGRGPAHIDPIKVRRLLTDLLDGDPRKALAAMQGPISELRIDAVDKVLRATIMAFDLVPFDRATGEGLREDEVLDILTTFLGWWNDLKKKRATSPMSPQSMDSGNGPATSTSAGCGPTCPASASPMPLR